MRGIVTNIDRNAQLGKYPVTCLYIKTEEGEEKKYNFFKNAKCIKEVEALSNGQNVEVKLEKNGKYWNPVDVSVIAASSPPTGFTPKGDFRTKEEIRRSVALDVAARLSKTGAEPKNVINLAMEFELYLEQGLNPADLLDATE